MTPPFLLTEAQMLRISPYFPRSHGRPRVDDQRVISGIVSVIPRIARGISKGGNAEQNVVRPQIMLSPG